jgi:hypothetical protein
LDLVFRRRAYFREHVGGSIEGSRIRHDAYPAAA